MGAWIEILIAVGFELPHMMSHPTMGAWIEMSIADFWLYFSHVAPHDGCVD